MKHSKHLSYHQQRRIRENQAKKRLALGSDQSVLGACQKALVVKRLAKHAKVLFDDGQIHCCNIRRNLSVVVNDTVLCRRGTDNSQGSSWVIEGVFARTNELTRPDYFDGMKTMAANLDKIIIVSSPIPEFSSNIIDRYLVICEKAKIPVLIILNKADLLPSLDEPVRKRIMQSLKIYADIGYQTISISTTLAQGIDELATLIKGTVIFVGQSGVGKSSIINALGADTEVGAVSAHSSLGQHTTTAAEHFTLNEDVAVIDSPGIREFGLWHLNSDDITKGYIEFAPFIGGCKFRDCKHLTDPQCLLHHALREGHISQMRFENYHRLIQSMGTVKEKRNFKQ